MNPYRQREIDFYFYEDHSARRRDFFLGIGVVGVAILFGDSQHLSKMVGTILALGCLIFFYVVRLSVYQPKSARESELPPHAIGSSRRMVLGTLVAAFCAAVFLLISFPETSEASVANRRARRLMAKGQDEEARRYARRFVDAEIPVEPDTLHLVAYVDPTQPPGGQFYFNIPKDATLGTPPILKLDSGEFLALWQPVVYLREGKYLIGGVIKPLSITMTGAGVQKTSLISRLPISEGAAMFEYGPDMLADAAILNASFRRGIPDVRPAIQFASVPPSNKRIAMVRVAIHGFIQTLDLVFWEETRFADCTIRCLGDPFTLSKVTFENCIFEFSPSFPETAKNILESSSGKPLSFNFR